MFRLIRLRPRRRGLNRHAARLDQDESGLALLFWAFSLLGLFAFFSIVADTGLIFVERRDLQNVADASALAGARELFESGATAAQLETTQYADDSKSGLVSNVAIVNSSAMTVTSTIGGQPGSFFAGALSLGNPVVNANATAQVGAFQLPGPGVFCVGTHIGTLNDEVSDHVSQLNAQGFSYIWDLFYDRPSSYSLVDGDYFSVLRFGAGDGSNAGYVDIGKQGGASQAVRTCFRNGSAKGLQPTEPTETGISAGPASQGLQDRLEDARDRGCYDWDDVMAELRAADANGDGVVEGTWRCSPNVNQATSVVLIPVVDQDFTTTSGGQIIDIHLDPASDQYKLAYFWLDAEQTFVNTSTGNWKFDTDGGGQGQMQIEGIFLSQFLTELSSIPGSGDIVACRLGLSTNCSILLVD
jgi:Flp pilus assembly protein TadG